MMGSNIRPIGEDVKGNATYRRCADRMCPGQAITSENDKLLHEGNEVEVAKVHSRVVCAMKKRA